MGVIDTIKGWWSKLFKSTIKDELKADIQLSDTMESAIKRFYKITEGKPEWNDKNDDIESINFAGFIDDVTAGLVTLDFEVNLPETARGKYLQEQADYIKQAITDKVSEGLGNCGIMLKPNGINVDYIEPGNFAPTETDSNGNILGCVFQSQLTKGDYTYTKLEHHRFDTINGEKVYKITNRAYKTNKKDNNDIGKEVPLTEVKEWEMLQPETLLRNVEKPLFAYFKNPQPNKIDRNSPLGVPIWANCIKELKDLDIAWSRKSGEIQDSKHITFASEAITRYADSHNVKLARFVKGVDMGITTGAEPIHEHVATLLTAQRIEDINSILAAISVKCGFSTGFFVYDQKQGSFTTATEVQASQQDTVRTIKNIRDALKKTLEDVLYALNVFADLYTDVPAEKWESIKSNTTFNFGDMTYDYEEDKHTWWQYVLQGKMPAWLYFTKFEGMSENEARAYIEEAENVGKREALFGAE